MNTLTRTLDGWEARLSLTGIGRWFSAAFLAFWLTFWAIGEAFAVGILGGGLWSLATGTPPGPERAPLELGPSLAMGGFLAFWTLFWTFGGVMAAGELLRLVCGVDRLRLSSSELEVVHRRGIFWRKRTFARRDVSRFYRIDAGPTLMAELDGEGVALSRMGSVGELDRISAAFASEWNLGAATESSALPKGWAEIVLPEGGKALTRNPARRLWASRIVAAVSVVFFAAALATLVTDLRRGASPLACPGFLIAAGLLAVWANSLARNRIEWVLHDRSLHVQRRQGSKVRPHFLATHLTLDFKRDSDGDAWHTLVAHGRSQEERRRSTDRLTLDTAIHDGVALRSLARWLVVRTNIPFGDATTQEAQTKTLVELKAQLAASGRFGKWVAGKIDRRSR